MRAHIQPRRPIVLLGSLLCMGLADQLASDMGIPWCFVNPSFYFGEDSGRPWDADFLGVSIRTFRYSFQPLLHKAHLVLHATDTALDVPPPNLQLHHHHARPIT